MTRGENIQGELWDELRVEHHWFHVVKSMILRGTMAEMGPAAWSVYCAIKSYANYTTGEIFASQDTLAQRCGTSVDTVQRAIAKLEEMGILQKHKSGRKNVYLLLENIPMTPQGRGGEVVGYATRPYVPEIFGDFMKQLKTFAESGQLPGDQKINITLNVNFINQGDNSNVTINNVSLDPAASSDPVFQSAYEVLAARLRSMK